uniref:VHS domain-containing protein n=1 Tax=Eptatretus burgeri TaxID=7764 RepID=A0A8C4QUZ7_EPTBU
MGREFGEQDRVPDCVKKKATNGASPCEDWNLIMEICDIINETEEGPRDAVKAIRKRLNGNKNPKEVILALTVLETCVKNCGRRIHLLVANQEFVESILVRLIQPKLGLPVDVQDKVLGLIQVRPQHQGLLVCGELRSKTGRFSCTLDETFLNANCVSTDKCNTFVGTSATVCCEIFLFSPVSTCSAYLCQDLNKTCRAMQQRVVELLDQVASDEITSDLLRVNDDLNNVFLRFDRLNSFGLIWSFQCCYISRLNPAQSARDLRLLSQIWKVNGTQVTPKTPQTFTPFRPLKPVIFTIVLEGSHFCR